MTARTKYTRVQCAARMRSPFSDEEGFGDDGNCSDASSTDTCGLKYQIPKHRYRMRSADNCTKELLRSKPNGKRKGLGENVFNDQHATIHQAARDGDLEQIRCILESLDPDIVLDRVNELDENRLAPLHYTARYNHNGLVQFLLDNGADISIRGENDLTPLHFAARYGYNKPNKQPVNSKYCLKQACRGVISLLVARGAYPNWQDTYGMTPLHYSAMRGNEVATEILLKCKDITTEAYDNQAMTALHCAANYNHPEIVRLLLSADAELRVTDENMSTPLHIAATVGNYEVVAMLLNAMEEREGKDGVIEYMEEKNKNAFTALHLAVNTGNSCIVDLLLEKGANARSLCEDANEPMHLAAVSGNVTVMKSLLKHRAIVNCSNIYRETPLHKAAAYNTADVIDFLLENDASIEYRDNRHFTPLLIASAEGHEATIERLLASGANIEVFDKIDRSVVFWASQQNHPKALKTLLQNEDGAALVNRCDRYDNSPLHIAASRGYTQIVEILLDHSADIARKNEHEKNPLHMAAAHGHFIIVESLLKRDKSLVNCEDENSNTAMHLAALHGHYQTVIQLLNAGANIHARNSNWWTALDCSASRGWKKTCETLLNAGCPIDVVDKSKTTPLHLAAREGHLEVVQLLLKWSSSIGSIDGNRRNCLNMAIQRGHENIAFEILASDNWEDVLRNSTENPHKSDFVLTPLRELIAQMPDVAEFVFDRCITRNKFPPDHPEHEIVYNYEYLDDIFAPFIVNCDDRGSEFDIHSAAVSFSEDSGEKEKIRPYSRDREILKYNHPLMLMITNHRQSLLNHPLCMSVLQHKWESYARYVYYFNLLTFVFFLVFLTAYILTGLPPCPAEEFGDPKCCWFLNSTCQPYIGKCHYVTEHYFPEICRNLIYVFAVVHLLKEVYQVYQNGTQCFGVENFLEWACYITALLFVADFTECSEKTGIREVWQWELGALSIFSAWMVFVMFISKFPFLGIYVVMFMQILSTFANFSFVFFLFVVAFGLAFYTLLPNQDPFETPGESILKTTVMMIGEFEYDAIFNDPNSLVYFKGPTYLLFVLFLLLMAIIIMNLLVGLAVDDIKGVQEQAQLKRLSMKVELVLAVERILPMIALRRCVIKKKVVRPNAGRKAWIVRMLRRRKYKYEKPSSAFKTSLEGLEDKQTEFSKQLKCIQDSLYFLQKDNKRLLELLENRKRNS